MELLDFMSPSTLLQGLIMTVCISFGIFLIVKDHHKAFTSDSKNITDADKRFEDYFNNLGKFLAEFIKDIFSGFTKYIPIDFGTTPPPGDIVPAPSDWYSRIVKLMAVTLLFLTVNILTGIISNVLASHWINSPNVYHFGFKELWVPSEYKYSKLSSEKELKELLKEKIWRVTFCNFFDLDTAKTSLHKISVNIKDTIINTDREFMVWQLNDNILKLNQLSKFYPNYKNYVAAAKPQENYSINTESKLFEYKIRYFDYMVQKVGRNELMRTELTTLQKHISFLQVFSMSFIWLFVLAFANMIIMTFRNVSVITNELDKTTLLEESSEENKNKNVEKRKVRKKLKLSLFLTWSIFLLIATSLYFGPASPYVKVSWMKDIAPYVQVISLLLLVPTIYLATKAPSKTNFISIITTLLILMFSFTCYFWSCKAWMHCQEDFTRFVVSSYKLVDDPNMPQDIKDLYDNTY